MADAGRRLSLWDRRLLRFVGGFTLVGNVSGLFLIIAVCVVMHGFHTELLHRVAATNNPAAVAQVQAMVAHGVRVLASLGAAAAVLGVWAFVLIRREIRTLPTG